MTLHSDLLERARKTSADLAEADRQAVLARAEHHTAVRRLHLAGGSLREIAEALALSHQRIQQIVNASGGSWWRKTWRSRGAPPEAVCSWCQRPPSEVGKLVAGPKVYICDACVKEAARQMRAKTGTRSRLNPLRARCSFCRRAASGGRKVLAGSDANVCDECLTLCREFMELEATD